MPLELRIARDADSDIRKAARWYAQQRSGLEQEFLNEIDVAMDCVSRTGDVMPAIYRNLRCLCVRRFPYGIYYSLDGDRATVVAVLHNRQSLTRLDSRKSK